MTATLDHTDSAYIAELEIVELTKAATRYGDACRREMELEDERSLLKPQAVVRLMEKHKMAATPAEKIVETDEAYMTLRHAQYACVVEKQRALGAFKAAELRATLKVGLATMPRGAS